MSAVGETGGEPLPWPHHRLGGSSSKSVKGGPARTISDNREASSAKAKCNKVDSFAQIGRNFPCGVVSSCFPGKNIPAHLDQNVSNSLASLLVEEDLFSTVSTRLAHTNVTLEGLSKSSKAVDHSSPGEKSGGPSICSDVVASPPVSAEAYTVSAAKHSGLCPTALCYILNPVSGHMTRIRALIDSGANLSLLNRSVARSIGLQGKEVQITIDTAGGGQISRPEKEVVFRLMSRDKTWVTDAMFAVTTESVGNPLHAVDFYLRKHTHLKDLELADDFPAFRDRPFQLIIAEPHVSVFQQEGLRTPPVPSPIRKTDGVGLGAQRLHRNPEAGHCSLCIWCSCQ